MSLTVEEFRNRLQSGRYVQSGDARRAAYKLIVTDPVRRRVLEGVDEYFGTKSERPFLPKNMLPSNGSAAFKLGDVARAKSERHQKAALAANKAKAEKKAKHIAWAEKERAWQAATAASKAAGPASPPSPPVPASQAPLLSLVSPPVPPPSQPALTLSDMRTEATRMVTELAARMPPPPAPLPAGAEHAFKVILDSTRELFELLAAEAKADERLRPDVLRVARTASQLVELGAEILRDKVRPSMPVPTPPASAPALGEAAQ